MRIRTPLEISILLNYHTRRADCENMDAHAVKETIKSFIQNGIIETREVRELRGGLKWLAAELQAEKDRPIYYITDLGNCYAEGILLAASRVSLPIYTCKVPEITDE